MTQKRVSGFTFIKHGLTLGYPILESVQSIDPLCDEVVINVGFDDPALAKDDGTYEYLRDNLPGDKYIFTKSHWDPKMTKSGLVLSQQTNIALEKCSGKYCQYIQGDEAIHEEDLAAIEAGLSLMDTDTRINGLVFKYLHFYGTVDTYKYTRSLYRREVRTIRNGLGIKSWLDAQGFRDANDQKIYAKLIDARIFHYGWARPEQVMDRKVKAIDRLYHGDDFSREQFKYTRNWGLKRFEQTHPAIMKNWIEANRNDIDLMAEPLTFDWHNIFGLMFSDFIESMTGYRIGEYKNYRLL